MKLRREQLRAKGWSENEIQDTEKLLRKIRRRKHQHHLILNEIIYWAILLLAVLAMITIATWIIPIFIFAESIILYPTLIIIALGFGLLFSTIIKDLDHLTIKHHIILSSVIPLVGIVSFLVAVGETNNLGVIGGNTHNALLVGIIFTSFFITPYIHELNKR